jgi:phage terminase large subunit-like protein
MPKQARPHVLAAHEYMDGVLSGRIIACEWVIYACRRHKEDLARANTADFPYVFDEEKAERACAFKAKMPHVKGKWVRKHELFELQGWQCFITAVLFGWIRTDTGLRRFLEAYIEVPRKNGKSFDSAATGLYMLTADGEPGAEVYSGATTEKQAWEVFGPMRKMALALPGLCARFCLEVRAGTMERIDDGSKAEPVIGKPGDGASPHCAIIDEFHEHETPDLYDTMATGMGAREQPLLYVITTAGTSLAGPCYQKHLYAKSVLNRTVVDESLFAIIYTIDEGEDWTTLDAAKKANPNFGVSVNAEYINRRLKTAQQSAYQQNAYKTKHLNVWCGAKSAWMNMLDWFKCPMPPALDTLKGRECYLGIDLGSTSDFSAIALLFPPEEVDGVWLVYWLFYLPEGSLEDSERAADFRAWEKLGALKLTEGRAADYETIETDIAGTIETYDVKNIGYDPYQANQLASRLMADGAPVMKVPQNPQQLSEPMKLFQRLVVLQRLAHGNNPVAAWMMGNVVAKEDHKDNIYPNKQSKEAKIDGVLAMLNAGALAFPAVDMGGLDNWLRDTKSQATAETEPTQ